ncbi:hypothetical protein VIBHAR_02995 [Vibrio campbellii ATCC BAA-1116]|uniref:Uncharacterized protein n=1 Tax=Vibrio campbellii (strain ATCC BAA-1116) TaxID=2902295 RepID=A7MUL5_VIBC1|nr:hypothetical protein VIBHAR_02995 [Vibrio campbellii ATCC BAA-1116]
MVNIYWIEPGFRELQSKQNKNMSPHHRHYLKLFDLTD